jgi:hypothetical protein
VVPWISCGGFIVFGVFLGERWGLGVEGLGYRWMGGWNDDIRLYVV